MLDFIFFSVTFIILMSFPLGRWFLKLLFWWIVDIALNGNGSRSLRYDFENDGPHYDYHSTELHAVKQNGGLYDEKR